MLEAGASFARGTALGGRVARRSGSHAAVARKTHLVDVRHPLAEVELRRLLVLHALELEEHGVVVRVALAAEEAVEAGLDVEAHRLGVALAVRLGALGRHLRFRARVRDAVALKLSAGRHRKTEEECAKLAEQR